MEHIEEILQKELAMKNQRLLVRRRVFEQKPLYVQSGLYYFEKFGNVRKQCWRLQVIASKILKNEGNS